MAILAQVSLVSAVAARLICCSCVDRMSDVVRRADALRALASRLGFAFREARRLSSCLAPSDIELFVSPIADVLSDVGHQLDVLRDRFPLASSPGYVRGFL